MQRGLIEKLRDLSNADLVRNVRVVARATIARKPDTASPFMIQRIVRIFLLRERSLAESAIASSPSYQVAKTLPEIPNILDERLRIRLKALPARHAHVLYLWGTQAVDIADIAREMKATVPDVTKDLVAALGHLHDILPHVADSFEKSLAQ